jgi:hypothetical protein
MEFVISLPHYHRQTCDTVCITGICVIWLPIQLNKVHSGHLYCGTLFQLFSLLFKIMLIWYAGSAFPTVCHPEWLDKEK